MFRYSGFALCIHSEIELPGLPPGGAEPDVIIRFGFVSPAPRQATADEEVAIHALAGRFHIRQGREILVDPAPGVDPAVLQVVLAGRMMAFLLRQRGWLTLHASGVRIDGQAILFLGISGAGKSTTAAAFYTRGHDVITDDVGAVRVIRRGECVLSPAGSRLRLLDDSRSVFDGIEPPGVLQWDKNAFDLSRGELEDAIPVRLIYALTDGDELEAERISPLAATALLSSNSFVRHMRMSRAALAAHIRDCAAVATAAPVYRLKRPRSLAALPALVRWVEADTGRGT
jgi:hypothetical protein